METEETIELLAIPTSQIERVPQPRRRSWGDIDALAESIRRDGQITAALVRELAPGRYQLVCGERRPSDLPRRAFEVTLRVSADTWAHAIGEMRHLVEHVEEHGPGCNSVSGGTHTGHIVTIEQRPEMTPERYREELRAWHERRAELEKRRAAIAEAIAGVTWDDVDEAVRVANDLARRYPNETRQVVDRHPSINAPYGAQVSFSAAAPEVLLTVTLGTSFASMTIGVQDVRAIVSRVQEVVGRG